MLTVNNYLSRYYQIRDQICEDRQIIGTAPLLEAQEGLTGVAGSTKSSMTDQLSAKEGA
jgi:putative protein kinase ArgK-like GTPase of G3E family